MPDFTTWTLEQFEELLQACNDAETGIDQWYGDDAAGVLVAEALIALAKGAK